MRPSNLSSFQIILLTAFGAFAVAGVLIFAFFVGKGVGDSIGQVTIWGTFDETAFSTVLRRLAENDSRLRQVTYVKKNLETYETDLVNALASGTGPDLFIMRDDYSVVDAPKILTIPYASISADQFRDLFVEGAEILLTRGGVLGVPLAVDPLVLYWNRDLLSSAGFSEPPKKWDEFYALARGVTLRNDEGSLEKSAVALGEFRNVTHAKEIITMLMMQAGGKVTIRDGAGNLTPSLVVRAGDSASATENALRFYTQFANPSTEDYSWNRSLPESRTAFATGDLGLYIGLASEEPLIRRMNPNLNFSVTAVPQLSTARSVVGGNVYAFAVPVPRQGANWAGARTVAFLLASSEASLSLATAFGVSSARRGVLGATVQCYECLNVAGSGCQQSVRDACSAASKVSPISGNEYLFSRQSVIVRSWEDPNPVETSSIFRDMIESTTSGALRVTEAIQRAEQAIRQLTQI